MSHRPLLFALLLSALLVGCNDNSDSSPAPEPQAQQTGFGEVELYDPVHHPDGHFIKPGQTAILALEGVNGIPTPDPGDTATAGVDEMWFEISEGGNLALSIREATLATIAQAELWNTTGGMLIRVNADTRQGSAELTPGRYGLRLYAAHTQENPLNLFIQVQEVPDEPATANRVLQASQQQVSLLLQSRNCPGCDLTRADLRGAYLLYADLSRADLSRANLTEANLAVALLTGAKLFGAKLFEANLFGADLRSANLFAANLFAANLQGADLSRANLTGADLRSADLTDANLYRADLTGANLKGADLDRADLTEAILTKALLTDAYLTGALLSGATWTDGRICALGSIGECL